MNSKIQFFIRFLLKRQAYLMCFLFIIPEAFASSSYYSDVVFESDDFQQVVQGKVIDEDGLPLPGATVIVAGTNRGTTTDFDGNFSIEAQDGDTLQISFVGFQTYEVTISNQTDFVIQLQTDSASLDEVVVVGYGTQRKSDLTGSVASIPQERLELVPNLNVAQALQGAIPGMMVQQTSAGAASTESIMVRGRNSILADNGPLIVVDGIPYGGELRDISVNNIQSIEVLKDASAAAVYGSRGANGVILVTTKIGVQRAPTITYEGRYSIQQYTNLPNLMTGEEFFQFKEFREPGNITATEQANYDSGNWVDWMNLATRNGHSQLHDLSVSGGSEDTQYYLAGNFLDVQGISITDNYTRATFRVNLDTEITNWLSFGTRTQLSYDDRSGSELNWDHVTRKNPLINPYDEMGNLTLYPWPEFTDIGNPLEPMNYDNSDISYQIMTNNFVVIDFPFIDGLSYRFNTGIRERLGDISTYIGRNTAVGLESRGVAETERSRFTNIVIENILNYRKEFQDHSFFATALFSYEQNKNDQQGLNASGFPNDFVSYHGAAQADLVEPIFSFYRTDLLSQMLRVNYTYMGKYLLTLTARRDGFSGFGEENKYGVFPSAAVGWNIADENFFPWSNSLPTLKLRASYGLNGNQAVGAYQSITRLGSGDYVSGTTTLPGYVPNVLGDANLGWESSKTLNIGIDFASRDNRLSGDLNYYRMNTHDLLLNRSISPVHGLSSITQNIGETRNTGVELSLNSQNFITNNFQWSTSANLSYIKNEIRSLYGILSAEGDEIDDPLNAWFIGHPILSNYDYVFDGVWQLDEADEAAAYGSQPGFVKLRDSNMDGRITAEDREIIGHRDPDFIWGLTNTFSYRNFTLNVFIHGVHGVTRLNGLLQDRSSSSGVRRNVITKNWWTPDNPTNEFYMNHVDADRMGGIDANIYQDASFVRVKDISLSFDFPQRILENIFLDNMRLFATGRNLFTFTEWGGIDPELDYGRGGVPLQKEFVFGLQVGF